MKTITVQDLDDSKHKYDIPKGVNGRLVAAALAAMSRGDGSVCDVLTLPERAFLDRVLKEGQERQAARESKEATIQ